MKVTKRSRDYFKEAMRREDYYRNSMIEFGVENLLVEVLGGDALGGCWGRIALYSIHHNLSRFRISA